MSATSADTGTPPSAQPILDPPTPRLDQILAVVFTIVIAADSTNVTTANRDRKCFTVHCSGRDDGRRQQP